MTRHLATRDGILCHTQARWPARSGVLRDVTCYRCLRRLHLIVADEDDARFERHRLTDAAEAAEFLGAGFVWSLVTKGGSPTERLVRDLLASIFVGLAEQHREERAA